MSYHLNLPGWLKPINRIVMLLNRCGLAIGTQHILTIVGRKSGKPISTPISLLTLNGMRYICTVGETHWVKNARAAREGTLQRGHSIEQVRLIELPVEERAAILREFPIQVPHGVQFFVQTLGVTNDPESFAAAAPRCPVFMVEAI